MKKFFTRIKPDLEPNDQSTERNNSLIGSWRLESYTDNFGREMHPRWKEIWSFAAMDEKETNGIYVCDYINLHSLVGKWFLEMENRIRLVRKECDNNFIIVELTEERFTLQFDDDDRRSEYLRFKRVV